MPELPEVEAIRQSVRSLLAGHRIRRCHVIHRIAVRPSSGGRAAQSARELEKEAPGRRVEDLARLGKYLLLRLDRGCIAMHFRLDGQLVWFDRRAVSGHVDVAFEFDNGTLGFVDQRHFGRVQWVNVPEDLAGIRSLGVDPLSADFTPASLAEILCSSRRPLKLLLMDQTRIAGLGNIYAGEALWCARLDPRRRANRLSRQEARRLHKAIVAVLQRALECCLDPPPDFRNSEWWFSGLTKILRVYGRAGQPCRRCGALIRRISQGNRSTFLCPHCQD